MKSRIELVTVQGKEYKVWSDYIKRGTFAEDENGTVKCIKGSGYLSNELSIRKATGFPPFSDVIRVLISGTEEQTALDTTKQVYERINEQVYLKNKQDFRFFGCMKAPIKKLQSLYRFQILMRVDKTEKDYASEIFSIVNEFNSKAVGVFIEINPNNLT